jgi:integrase
VAKIKVKSVGRPALSESAPGVFKRNGSENFWLRYSTDGVQVRVSLETTDRDEANKRASELRGRKILTKNSGKNVGGKTELDRALDRYIAAGGIKGKLGTAAKKNARQAVNNFRDVMGITDPARITTVGIKEYYQKLNGTWVEADPKASNKKALVPVTTWMRSEATAQTYSTRVATFTRYCGYKLELPPFPEAPSRDVVVPAALVDKLLELDGEDVKFVLMAGFRAGMRRAEIVWARPEWFVIDTEKPCIRIPRKDPVTAWEPKSKRARQIPLTSDFVDFIRKTYPGWNKRAFCIRPEKAPGKWIYRFDDRKMFERLAAAHCPELTHHTMRHTYASHLANGGVGIAQLAAWTGDRIATLEKHYLHLSADAEKAEEAFSAHRNPTARQAQAALADKISWMKEMLEAQHSQLGLSIWLETGNPNDEVEGAPKPRRTPLLDY